MNSEISDNNFSLYGLLEYIKSNFVGLLLLLLAVFIVYFVDHISRINAMLFSMPSAIPSISNTIVPKKSKKIKK